jgi:hypothetical protein
LEAFLLKYNVDFTVEPIPKRHGQKARVKPFYTKEGIMQNVKQFKNPPALREYWRTKKAEERSAKKAEKNEC